MDIDSVAEFVIYADDTRIFLSSLNSDELVDAVNFTLSELEAWARENGQSINAEKAKTHFYAEAYDIWLKFDRDRGSF